jgi:uncharacterized membrane protein YhaH (DUF805 family)
MEASSATSQAANPEPQFFLPRGRIGVRSMLVRGLTCYLVLLILGSLLRTMSAEIGRELSIVLTYLLAAFMCITSIKRAHDMDYSGWAVFWLSILPFVLLLPGTKGPNQFGPPPARWF